MTDHDTLINKGWKHHDFHPETADEIKGGWWIHPKSTMANVIDTKEAMSHHEIWLEWEIEFYV